MWKVFLLSFLVWQQLGEISAQNEGVDTAPPNISTFVPKKKQFAEESSPANSSGVQFHFNAANIIFNIHGRPSEKLSEILPNGFGEIENVTRVEHRVVPGIGVLKLHSRPRNWNIARRTCIEQGGHLAVIRSQSESMIVNQMMIENSVDEVWLGFHDQFEEGEWVTVMDEPFASSGWAKWSKDFKSNPDNYGGSQHCARFPKNADGLDDDSCDKGKPFVCKISKT